MKKLLIDTAIITIIIVILNLNTTYSQNISEDTLEVSNNIDIQIKKQDKSKLLNLDEIIELNERDIITEKIQKEEIDVEFNTQYRENNALAKGKIQTLQEGQDGKQNAIIKSSFKNDELEKIEQISSEITRASIDKIVEIGTGAFSSNYVPIVGDKLEATPETLAIRKEPSETAEKIVTINRGDKVTLKSSTDDWYFVKYDSFEGYAQKSSLKYVDPNNGSDGDENNILYSREDLTREEVTQNIGFSMLLNQKSGLSLKQFQKIFENDTNDKKGILKENAQYFYYAEQQYNVNGIFVAAVAVHESGWGLSNIAQAKKNLFGYQAYDRDPYGSASTFETYAEGIDLVSRVFVKYYLNPKGTPIYGGEVAAGTYYKGSTVSAVNVSYATDKNWANAVYKWMLYLYNKV